MTGLRNLNFGCSFTQSSTTGETALNLGGSSDISSVQNVIPILTVMTVSSGMEPCGTEMLNKTEE